jgi:ribosomal protein L11 methylase PrmA
MSAADGAPPRYDPGSFRDPGGRVFAHAGRIFRAIMAPAADDYRRFRASGLEAALVDAGRLIASVEVDPTSATAAAPMVVEHPQLEMISYPYEWSFALLRRAALHHLDLQIDALAAGFVLSDASAYNIQFIGTRAIFIDPLSITPYEEDTPWTAHRQFCMQFLNPLILSSRLGIAPNAWFRGSLEGIAPEELAPLLRWRDHASWTMLSHVRLQAAMQTRLTRSDASSARVREARLPRASFLALLKDLRHFIAKSRAPSSATVWNGYADDNSYAASAREQKRAFVSRTVAALRPALLVDLGCNTGDYAVAALEAGAKRVIGFDFDHGALDGAVARADAADLPFLPLWLDAANPSPAQGWAERERKGLAERLSGADAVVALAFVHHLAIGRNVPLDMVIDWIIGLAPAGVIEFAGKDDPMVQALLAQRRDIFADYHEEAALAAIGARATIVERLRVNEGRRLLVRFDRRR